MIETLKEKRATAEQSYNSLQTELNDSKGRQREIQQEMARLQGEYRVLSSLIKDLEAPVQDIAEDPALTLEAIPQEEEEEQNEPTDSTPDTN